MKTIKINIGEEIYKVIQHTPTINLYKILHLNGFFEITKNNYSGKWKVLMQNNKAATLPLIKIGKAIEEHFTIGNQQSMQA